MHWNWAAVPLLDLGIYPISFAWDILGKPAFIQAIATFRDTGADAQVATLFHYETGAIATTLSASDSAGPNRACVIGRKGRIEIDRVRYTPTTFRVYDTKNVSDKLRPFRPCSSTA
jgi:predicted dehydrogenase